MIQCAPSREDTNGMHSPTTMCIYLFVCVHMHAGDINRRERRREGAPLPSFRWADRTLFGRVDVTKALQAWQRCRILCTIRTAIILEPMVVFAPRNRLPCPLRPCWRRPSSDLGHWYLILRAVQMLHPLDVACKVKRVLLEAFFCYLIARTVRTNSVRVPS